MKSQLKNLSWLLLSGLIAFGFLISNQRVDADDWAPAGHTLLSKFAQDVNPDSPLPEYPRPQMVRKNWKNLNGDWDYAILPVNEKYQGQKDGEILVPYPIESALSGVAKRVGKENNLWYKEDFELPKNWANKRILLNFGAVDWVCEVFVNGKSMGTHQGGYTPFTLDITDAIDPTDDDQDLVVKVWDPTNDGPQPIGKQHNTPHGIWYTPVTGIWQTVWIEPVPNSYITKVLPVPNIDEMNVAITVFANGTVDGQEAKINGQSAPFIDGKAVIVLDQKNAKLWTPDSPTLYNFTVDLVQNGNVIDTVESYFAMRKISLGKTEDGITRILLNNEFLFQHGPLDQGWWPDGLYTAPTDEALASDVVTLKNMGFNMLRKHVKVEPWRYYYHCDRLGMLVWQDMPSGDTACYIGPDDPDAKRTPESAAIYEHELKEVINAFDVFPCIIMWVPFNEGWGQYDTERIVEMVRQLDPTRLVNNTSGWSDRKCGDVYDMHKYPGPGMFPPEENRASVLGEYGGLGLPVKGHSWKEDGNWGYVRFDDMEALFQRYNQLNRQLHKLIGQGLSAAVYTQTTDVEIEVNGFMSYDREVVKFPVDKMRESNLKLHGPAPVLRDIILPGSQSETQLWKYTTEKPADNWFAADFDDSTWDEGAAGFGQGAPNTTNRTKWDTSDIWLRTTITLDGNVADPQSLLLNIYHDEDAEVYWNGTLVASFSGYVTDYYDAGMNVEELRKVIKAGENTIAVHCHQTAGGQYIDLGIKYEDSPEK